MPDKPSTARRILTGETLTERMSATEREQRWPNTRPKDASSLIILDRSGRKPKVLMGRRHMKHKFMPGMFVFPGGRVENWDRIMCAAGSLPARAEDALTTKVSRPSAQRGRLLALAAIRETFEETGLLLGTKEFGPPENAPEGPWQAFQEHGIFPDLEAMNFIARAITPPRRPRRFDTRFFAVERSAIAGEVPGVVTADSELTELAWVNLDEARAMPLPAITLTIIDELDQRIEDGFSPNLPIPFYYEKNRRSLRDIL